VCGKSGVQIPNQPNMRQFANGSPPLEHLASIAMLTWLYDAELGTANSLHGSAENGEYWFYPQS